MLRAPRVWIGVVVVGALVALNAIWAFDILFPAASAERRIETIIESGRPTRGALYNYGYAEHRATGAPSRNLGAATILARRISERKTRGRLLATIAMTQNDFDNAALVLEDLRFEFPDDAEIANNLGVAYLEIAERDTRRLLDAVSVFLKAATLDPFSAQIAYNVALTFGELQLPRAASDWLERHRDLEGAAPWFGDLRLQWESSASPNREPEAIETSATRSWEETLDDTGRWWDALIHVLRNPRALAPSPDLDALTEAHERRFGDRTPQGILEPLVAGSDEMMAVRRAITVAENEQSSSSEQALDTLDSVGSLVRSLPADDFDRLRWSIIRAENAFRIVPGQEQLDALRFAVTAARDADFIWLYGHGLESLAGALGAGDQLTLMERNRAAFDTLSSIGAAHDAMRARTALGYLTWFEGDWETSFELSVETMRMAPESDHLRWFAALEVLIQNPLLPEPVTLAYVDLLLDHATELGEGLLANAVALAARVHAEQGDFEATEELLGEIRASDSPLPAQGYFHQGFAQARMQSARGTNEGSLAFFADAAARMTSRGLNVFTYPIYLEWARAHHRLGDGDSAARAIDQALESVERSNSQVPRLSFDSERRRVYETAIRFGLERDTSAAWRYLQRYKTQLDASLLPQLGRADSSISEPTDVPDLNDRTLLEYTLLEDGILIWLIDDGNLDYFPIPVDRERFTEDVQRYLHSIERRTDASRVNQLGQALYETLIAPVRPSLDPEKPIIIIPDRVLHRLPFAALPSPEGRFLVEDFSIAQSPTLVRAIHDAPRWNQSPRLLALGPRRPSIRMRRELDTIQSIYPSMEVIDSAAITRTRFLEASQGASMIHVTGHSAVDGATGLTSAIYLDGINGTNTVTANEVAGLELDNGSLVVLASCDSSVGNMIGGIGVRGLTSAFLAAGAGAVVGSLWPVDDEITSELMTSFHGALIEGDPVASALATTQREFIAAGRHPYEWAAFSVTGDQTATRPIPIATTERAAVSP